MSKQEELRESIFNILIPFDRTPVNEMVNQILKACKDMDMAFVDRDAESPLVIFDLTGDYTPSMVREVIKATRKAYKGSHKVVEIKV